MSNPESKPLPEDFDENPEWTEEDFAQARRGAPWLWKAAARTCIREAIAELEPVNDSDHAEVQRAIAKMNMALNELENEQGNAPQ